MKRILYFTLSGLIILFSACQKDFIELDPLDSITEVAYFNKPEHFEAAANDLYSKMLSWKQQKTWGKKEEDKLKTNIYDYMDLGSDLTSLADDYGRGILIAKNKDVYWTISYMNIRSTNILLEKANEFSGDATEIAEYVAAAKFFRAFHHFFLLQRFGGVPVVTSVLDLDSPELYGKRNSRYEVVNQIIKDLDEAIPNLPLEQNIASTDKGHLSNWAAMAFKAKVLLYEATWERYVGKSTDGDGVTTGAGSLMPDNYLSIEKMLSDASELAKNVMNNGGYELWNKNSSLDNLSSYYLFNLEDAGSNPAGLDKASNKEFILYSKYDFDLLQGGVNISHTVGTRLAPSRSFMDMFLCADGLPVDKSDVFQGYTKTSDEYKNRDYRLVAYFGNREDGSVTLSGSAGFVSGAGYGGRKFAVYQYGSRRAATEESSDYPQIRLAEVYLIYAEALYELNGSITDAQLNESINKIKARAGLPALTNAFATANDLDMMEEIRRERAIELFAENTRFNDLKRWGVAEDMLNQDICGSVIEGTDYENNADLYTPSGYPYGETTVSTGVGNRRVLLIDPSTNRNFQRKNYLFPLPLGETNLNKELLQNPGY